MRHITWLNYVLKNGLNYKSVDIKPISNVFEEGLFAEVRLSGNDSLLCATLYIRGESTDLNNDALLDTLNALYQRRNSHLIIMGDLNMKR